MSRAAILIRSLGTLLVLCAFAVSPGHAGPDTASRTVAAAASGATMAQAGAERYAMIDQWPKPDAADAGLIRDAVSLDVAADGRSYVSDRGVNGVHIVQPDGRFDPPFGTRADGDGPETLRGVGDLSVARSDERVYVADQGASRIVIYDLDGGYQGAWSGIDAAAVAAAEADTVFLADRETNQIRAFAADGTERYAYGGAGTETGSFSGLADVSVSEDGGVLAVLDHGGHRVQLFDIGPAGLSIRAVYDLNQARYATRLGRRCMPLEAERPVVNALGGLAVWVGEGTNACHIVDGQTFHFVVPDSAASRTICGPTVHLARVLPELGVYTALATYNPNPGPCVPRGRAGRGKEANQPTTPAVVRYRDERLAQVEAVALAAADSYQDAGLQAPRKLALAPGAQTLIMDRSRRLRLFGLDGTMVRSFPTVSSYADAARTSGHLRLEVAAVSDGSPDEIIAYYVRERGVYDEHGFGRFKVVETLWRGQTVEVIEAQWTLQLGEWTLLTYAEGGIGYCRAPRCGKVLDLAHDPDSGMLFALYERYQNQNHWSRATPESVEIMVLSDDGRRQRGWDLELAQAGSLAFNPYSSVDVGPDGRVVVLDDVSDQAIAFDGRGTELARIPVERDVWRIAGGPDGQIFGLRLSGYVESYAEDGTLLARFDGRPFSTSEPATLSDLEVHADGRVLVSDEQTGLVSVFAPADPATSLPAPDGADCAFLVDKVAAPDRLQLGESTRLTLSLSGACGVAHVPTDVVVVVPQLYRDETAVNGHLLLELRQLLGRIDLDVHRVGLLSFHQTALEEQPLTHEAASLDDAIAKIRRSRRYGQPPVAQVREGIHGAAAMLADSPSDRRTVILLVQAPYCSRDLAAREADCSDYKPAEDAATAAREAGHRIIAHQYGLGGWTARHVGVLADSDADVTGTAAEAAQRVLAYSWPDHLATEMEVVDRLPETMALVVGSISAPGTATGDTVRWQLPTLDRPQLSFTLEVTPLQPGRLPTNVEAVASFVDGWGRARRLVFPVPEVEVIAPTATPGLPTSTPLHTATATEVPPTSVPQPIFLPLVQRHHCLPSLKRLDVALVVDTSSSMAGEKLVAAKRALRSFIGVVDLRPGGDRAALISFDEHGRTLTPLTEDPAAMEGGVDALATAPGTRIDRGLEQAMDTLAPSLGDPGRVQLIILLSDGRQEEVAPVVDVAGRAREAGVIVYAIGLGDDVDGPLLERAVGHPDRYRFAPTPADLRAIYEGIAREIPCW